MKSKMTLTSYMRNLLWSLPLYFLAPVPFFLLARFLEIEVDYSADTPRDVTGVAEAVAIVTADALVQRGRDVSGVTEAVVISNLGYSLDTYHADVSDAGPTDTGAVWTADGLAFNGDTGDFATTSGSGSGNEITGDGSFSIDDSWNRMR